MCFMCISDVVVTGIDAELVDMFVFIDVVETVDTGKLVEVTTIDVCERPPCDVTKPLVFLVPTGAFGEVLLIKIDPLGDDVVVEVKTGVEDDVAMGDFKPQPVPL